MKVLISPSRIGTLHIDAAATVNAKYWKEHDDLVISERGRKGDRMDVTLQRVVLC